MISDDERLSEEERNERSGASSASDLVHLTKVYRESKVC